LNYSEDIKQDNHKKIAKRIFSTLYTSYDKVVLYFTFFQELKWKMRLLSLSNLKSCDKVLDIGIGTGFLEEFYRNCSVPQFIGIDMSKEMLQACMKKKLNRIDDLIQADAENLPFRCSSFDVVVSCYVTKYCKQGIFCNQASSVLKPCGRLVLYDFAKPTRVMSLNYIYVFGILPFLGRLAAPFAKQLRPTLEELPKVIASSDWEASIELELMKNRFKEVKSEMLNAKGARLVMAKK